MRSPSRGSPRSAEAKRAEAEPATGSAEAEAAEDGEGRAISVYGNLHGGLTQIRASSVRLVLTFGEFSDGRDVLVPLVDWQTFGHQMSPDKRIPPDDVGLALSSQLMSLDNLAFLLQDLSFDTHDAVRLLATQSKGGVAPVAERMQYAARMLRLASAQLSSAAEELDGLLPDPDEERTPAPPSAGKRLRRPSRQSSRK